ncbi:hypothetical protein COHA_009739 [Chlorella ohadii]|uniref:F-box domain-containing protein n=1 Tax=Chlorella ohadii TaxID=2649997 RepID=A0AAD5H173_9CHLO|nr:hypothetical protein COHA_009739 [Chlorella ohadii]
MDLLPEAVLTDILDCLDGPSLRAAKLVCRRWRLAASQPRSLRVKMPLKDDDLDSLLRLLHSRELCNRLSALALHAAEELGSEHLDFELGVVPLLAVARDAPALQRLALVADHPEGSDGDDRFPTCLPRSLPYIIAGGFRALEWLSVSGFHSHLDLSLLCPLPRLHTIQVSSVVPRCRSYARLRMTAPEKVLRSVTLRPASPMPSLRTIHLSRCVLNADFSHLPGLLHLHLWQAAPFAAGTSLADLPTRTLHTLVCCNEHFFTNEPWLSGEESLVSIFRSVADFECVVPPELSCSHLLSAKELVLSSLHAYLVDFSCTPEEAARCLVASCPHLVRLHVDRRGGNLDLGNEQQQQFASALPAHIELSWFDYDWQPICREWLP